MANDPCFEVYPRMVEAWGAAPAEPTGEYGWRFRAADGQIAATSGEGFTRREDAHRAVSDFADDVIDLVIDTGEGYVREHFPILNVED